MRLLIVEDDRDLRKTLAARLAEARFLIDEADDGEVGLHLAETGAYAAIVLDIGLPVLDGLSVLAALRAKAVATPVLLLTARDRWHDKVLGLRAGADDYLGKPFETEELMARLEALIRRAGGHGASRLALGAVEIDLAGHEVRVSGERVSLSPIEYRALAFLAVNRGRVVSKAELAEHLYQEDLDRDPNVIEVTIARLRKKVGAGCILTRRGLGYCVA